MNLRSSELSFLCSSDKLVSDEERNSVARVSVRVSLYIYSITTFVAKDDEQHCELLYSIAMG